MTARKRFNVTRAKDGTCKVIENRQVQATWREEDAPGLARWLGMMFDHYDYVAARAADAERARARQAVGGAKGGTAKAQPGRAAREAIRRLADAMIAAGEDPAPHVERWAQEHGYRDSKTVRRIVSGKREK